MDGCNGFTRSEMLRRGLAAPGAGLPEIEPGMPMPAGTGMSRRSLVLRGAGMALAVYGAGKLVPGAFEEGIAEAAGAPAQPVLVSIFMAGGVDGLNVLAPTEDATYQKLRPTIGLTSASTLPVSGNSALRWNSAAASLKTLHDAGKVAIAPAIGYDHPDQSHFTSRHFWEVGQLSTSASTGWMGRYLDLHGLAANPIQGLSLDSTLSPALATANVAVAAAASPTSYTFISPGVNNAMANGPMMTTFGALGQLASADPITAQARQAQANAAQLRTQLAQTPTTGGATYPSTSFAKKLQNLGRMLGVGLPMRCVTLSAAGSYDTHSGEAGALQSGLQQTCDGIAAFQADLEARGLADRVIVHLWSEFGRRPEENGSSGTDHGAGGVSFVIGKRVAAPFIGEHPGLGTLDSQDNLRSTSDFRDLYRAMLEQWMGVDSAPIIPGSAGTIPTLIN
ncbi:MAG: hypothetical protein JWM71_885 [Solirubrobacteraceae bacterium]|nr:hypothetical protein [Solirubrobacteraceae bacterium]